MPVSEIPPPSALPPLRGVRVLDLTRVLAGPYCTMILADLGADVVKVEHPRTGDDARHFGPFLPSGTSAYFAGINRGKRSIALDLKDETDRGTLLKLVEKADVLVENFRPGTLDGFGLPAETLHARNPRLIVASLSGFGNSDEARGRPAYDVVIQALSGLMSITGEGPGSYVRVGTSISDILTGMYGAIAVVSALVGRAATGRGTAIDLSMLDCTVSAMENALSRFSVTGQLPEPLGTRHPSITPFQAFDAADGPLVVGIGNDGLWKKFCTVLNRPEWVGDSRFQDNNSRTRNRTELEACLGEVLREQPRDHWLGAFQTVGIPAAPIRNIAEVLQDPLLQSRQMLHLMADHDGQTFLTAGSPLRFDGSPPPLSDHAPEHGEHTSTVLAEWLNDT